MKCVHGKCKYDKKSCKTRKQIGYNKHEDGCLFCAINYEISTILVRQFEFKLHPISPSFWLKFIYFI